MVVVIPFRRPAEVAKSLQERDGFSIAHGYLLWLRHVIDAEHGTRDAPRAFVDFEELAGDFRPAVDRFLGQLPIDWPRRTSDAFDEIEAFMDSELKHHGQVEADRTVSLELVGWVRDAYAACRTLVQDPQDGAACAMLDAVRASFNAATQIFEPAVQGIMGISKRRLEEADSLTAELKRTPAAADQEITARDDAIIEGKNYAASLLAELESTRAGATREIAAREKAIAEGQRYAAALAAEFEKTRTAAAREIAERDRSIAEGQRYAASLVAELEKTRAAAVGEIAERDRSIVEAQNYARSLSTELDKARALSADAGPAVPGLSNGR